MNEKGLAVILVAGFGAMLLWPLMKALADRIRRGPPQPDTRTAEEVDALRDAMLAELQQLRREMVELGERMDFAEWLRARGREPGRIPPVR